MKNNLTLTIALHSAPKHPDVAEVFSDLVHELRSMRTNLGADLVAYGIMNPTLQQAILEVIRADSLLTSAEQLTERIHTRLKELLPPEATTSIKKTVNYLAEEFALAHDVGGYKLGLGIYRED